MAPPRLPVAVAEPLAAYHCVDTSAKALPLHPTPPQIGWQTVRVTLVWVLRGNAMGACLEPKAVRNGKGGKWAQISPPSTEVFGSLSSALDSCRPTQTANPYRFKNSAKRSPLVHTTHGGDRNTPCSDLHFLPNLPKFNVIV